jgi:hypothetical protein
MINAIAPSNLSKSIYDAGFPGVEGIVIQFRLLPRG